jgi:hypothetical protein
MHNFEGMDPGDVPIIRKDIEILLQAGRTVSMRSGRGEEYQELFTAEENLTGGVDEG